MPLLRKRTVPGQAGRRAARTAAALDKRLPVTGAGKEFLRKAFPDHWSFLLGEIALYAFLVLTVTGVFLTFFFHADMTREPYGGPYQPLRGVRTSVAYSSVLRISFEVRGGLLLRQVHHWGALVFVAAVGLHMLRIFFTGAFRRPREINWMIGVTLFMLALLEGFLGYSLPDDLLSGTGLRTAQGIVLSIPVLGTYLALFLFGGEFPGHEIIPRMYSAHVLLVPGLIVALLVAHLSLVVYLKHTHWGGLGRTNRNVVGKPLFPQYTAKSVGLLLAVAGVLTALGAVLQINPVWDFGPYRPDQASTDAQPDWYVGFLEGALRTMPALETRLWGHTVSWDVLVPGVLLPTLLFTVLYTFPYLERWLGDDTGEHHLADRPRNQPVRTGLGAAGVTCYGVLLAAGGQDVLAYRFDLPVEGLTWTFRVAVFLLPFLVHKATRRLCLGLQAHDRARLVRGDPAPVAHRVGDGYRRARVPLGEEETYRLLVRDTPYPLPEDPLPREVRRRRRLRLALSRWYYGTRVELPTTPKQRRRLRRVTRPPSPRPPTRPGPR